MEHDEIERMLLEPRRLVRRQDVNVSLAGKAIDQAFAHAGRRLAEKKLAGRRRHEVGVQGFAAAIIEHAGLRPRHERGDVLRDQSVMHVLMACIDIDRVWAVPESKPVCRHARHSASNGPSGPNTGSASGGGTLGMTASAWACSALLPRQRLYCPFGG